jgi:hypothetical protein
MCLPAQLARKRLVAANADEAPVIVKQQADRPVVHGRHSQRWLGGRELAGSQGGESRR